MRRATPEDPACSEEQERDLIRMLRLAVDTVPDSRRRAKVLATMADDLMALPESVPMVAEREKR